MRLLEGAAGRGGGFSILWHTDRFDPASSQRWDRLYERVIDAVYELGGVCMSAAQLCKEAAASLR